MIGCFSHQPDALTRHPQRVHPARLSAESVPKGLLERRWPAVMMPRHARLRAAEVVPSHRAADDVGPSIQAARTHASFISRGAAAGFPAFRSANAPGNRRSIPRGRLSVEPRPFEIRENEKIGDQSTTINPIKYSKFSRRQASLSRSFSCAKNKEAGSGFDSHRDRKRRWCDGRA